VTTALAYLEASWLWLLLTTRGLVYAAAITAVVGATIGGAP